MRGEGRKVDASIFCYLCAVSFIPSHLRRHHSILYGIFHAFIPFFVCDLEWYRSLASIIEHSSVLEDIIFFFYVFRYPLSLNCLNFVAGDVLKGYILSIMIYKNYIFNTLQCFRDNSTILIM